MGLTGGFVLIFLLNTFVCGDKEEPAQQSTVVKAMDAEPGNVVQKILSSGRKQRPVGRKIQNITFKGWGKDPFLEAERITAMDSSWVDSSEFVLRGIIWKGNQAHALIGDMILKEGDRSGDLKVLSIKKNTVVCRKGSRIVTLALRKDDE